MAVRSSPQEEQQQKDQDWSSAWATHAQGACKACRFFHLKRGGERSAATTATVYKSIRRLPSQFMYDSWADDQRYDDCSTLAMCFEMLRGRQVMLQYFVVI